MICTSEAYLEDIGRKWMTDNVGTNVLLILLYTLGRGFSKVKARLKKILTALSQSKPKESSSVEYTNILN